MPATNSMTGALEDACLVQPEEEEVPLFEEPFPAPQEAATQQLTSPTNSDSWQKHGYRTPDVSATYGKKLEVSDAEWEDKFGFQNVVVGIGLAAWGAFVSLGHSPTGADKFLEADTTLNNFLSFLQYVTICNGALLFLAGLGIRSRQSWGFPLGYCCAMICICAGAAFLWGFTRVGNPGGDLVHATARVYYIRYNFDLIAEFVAGCFLLRFLFKQRSESVM